MGWFNKKAEIETREEISDFDLESVKLRSEELREAYRKKFPYKKAYSPVKKSRPFPLGVKGLVPLQTVYMNGSHMCWIFVDDEGKREAMRAVESANQVLAEASEIAAVDLGKIESLVFEPDPRDLDEVLAAGDLAGDWGYTRVDYSPITLTGSDCDTPVKLRLETCETSGTPDSHYGTIAYSPSGEIKKIEVTYCDSDVSGYKTTAGMTKTGLVVKKIERWATVYGDKEVLYKSY